jgi:hypothetical protein
MPKGIAAIILAKKKPKDDEENADGIGMKALAGDLISAVKDGNKQAIVDAFKGMYNACSVANNE